MTKEEWIEFYKSVNGREPSQTEIDAAQASGVFSPKGEDQQTSPNQQAQASQTEVSPNVVQADPRSENMTHPQAQVQAADLTSSQAFAGQMQAGISGMQTPVNQLPKKKTNLVWKILALAVIAVLILGAGGGGFAWWHYKSGDIRGTWEMTDSLYYNKKKKKWESRLKDYTKLNEVYTEVMTIDKDNQIKNISFTVMTSEYDYTFVPYSNKYRSFRHVDQWNRKIETSLSKSDYRKMVSKATYKELSHTSKSDIEDLIKSSVKNVYDYQESYQVKENRLTISRKDKKGKVVSKITYKKLSKAQANQRKEDFKKAEYDSEHGH